MFLIRESRNAETSSFRFKNLYSIINKRFLVSKVLKPSATVIQSATKVVSRGRRGGVSVLSMFAYLITNPLGYIHDTGKNWTFGVVNRLDVITRNLFSFRSQGLVD